MLQIVKMNNTYCNVASPQNEQANETLLKMMFHEMLKLKTHSEPQTPQGFPAYFTPIPYYLPNNYILLPTTPLQANLPPFPVNPSFPQAQTQPQPQHFPINHTDNRNEYNNTKIDELCSLLRKFTTEHEKRANDQQLETLKSNNQREAVEKSLKKIEGEYEELKRDFVQLKKDFSMLASSNKLSNHNSKIKWLCDITKNRDNSDAFYNILGYHCYLQTIIDNGRLSIVLRLVRGDNDSRLVWPASFSFRITIISTKNDHLSSNLHLCECDNSAIVGKPQEEENFGFGLPL